MQARGLSQESLAAALSCTRGAVGHYLTGRRSPSLLQLEKLAAALDADPAWLLYGEGGEVREMQGLYRPRRCAIALAGNISTGLGRRPRKTLALPGPGDNCYALLIDVNNYEPRIHAGEAVVIDPEAVPVAGDEVLLQYRDGRLALHLLLRTDGGAITVDNITGEKQVRTLTKGEYKSVHTVIAVLTVRGESTAATSHKSQATS